MIKIRVINPNTTASMTRLIGESARAVAGSDVLMGPASIESHYDESLAVPGILAEVARGEAEGVDGYVIACFGDPGLEAARELARGPVVGIAEAAMRTAAYLGRSFSVGPRRDLRYGEGLPGGARLRDPRARARDVTRRTRAHHQVVP